MASMSNEDFQKLIENIKLLAVKREPVKPQSARTLQYSNVFFAGSRDAVVLESFITAVETFKEANSISDADALKGLPLQFYDIAKIWWKGVGHEAKTWQDALQLLRDHFTPTKPPYLIYIEIFENKQEFGEAIDTFICKQRELLVKLPEGRHNEETEIDFVYGLLQPKYRDQIPRTDIKTFTKLIERGRNLERKK